MNPEKRKSHDLDSTKFICYCMRENVRFCTESGIIMHRGISHIRPVQYYSVPILSHVKTQRVSTYNTQENKINYLLAITYYLLLHLFREFQQMRSMLMMPMENLVAHQSWL